MLTYAGVPLLSPTKETADWVEKHISPNDTHPWAEPLTGKNRSYYTITGGNVERPIKLGTLYWPTGASRWAVGYFLASAGEIGSIRQKVYASGSYVTQPLVMDDGKRKITTNLWMLPPRRLAQLPNYNGLYLLTLVDDRYFW